MTNKTAKKNKKVFREGVVEIHGRFTVDGEGNPVIITAKGASRGVKSVEIVGSSYRVTLNMPKATFLGAPALSYIDTGVAVGSIYTLVLTGVASSPVPQTNPITLPSFDIGVFNANNEVVEFPEGAVCGFTVTVSTSVVPSGMLPNVENEAPAPPAAWSSTTPYVLGDKVTNSGRYFAALDVSGNLDKEPGVDEGWELYWDEYSLFPNEVVARTAIGGNAIVHTPKVESVSVYGRFYGEFVEWSNLFTYAIGMKAKADYKNYEAIKTSLNVEPGVTVGWEEYWKEIGLLITDNAESEGVLSVELNDNGQYPDLPANVYVITLDPVSPVVQFLGAGAVMSPFAKVVSVSAGAFNRWKVFCEGESATYGTSANQIVVASYFYDAQINPVQADTIHFTINYTTSNVF